MRCYGPSDPVVLTGPPQTVHVVQLGNSTTVRVSWEPPVTTGDEELVLEYRVRDTDL